MNPSCTIIVIGQQGASAIFQEFSEQLPLSAASFTIGC